eukprot:g8274.t1
MMDSIASVLAPKLEVGQAALYDALRARDAKRATRIVKRVASEANARQQGSGAVSRRSTEERAQEADLNAPDSEGLRPIHLAAMRGMSETVTALIDAGVPPDAMGAEGNTALHLASWHKEEGAVAALMRAGASPTHENMKGSTAIDLAKTETTLTLLCPLHYCAARGMLDNLVAEVAKGRSVNSAGRGGDTPLHAAATSGNTDATRLLLARGADPLRRNNRGETPLDVARRNTERCDPKGGLFGGNLVGVLEGAVEEAAAAKAAVEAEKAAKFGEEEYQEGEEVAYMRNGEGHPAVVMKVHRDDEEPYYTVRVHATGRERQTDSNHLVRSLPQGAAPASTAHGEGKEPVGAGHKMKSNTATGGSNSHGSGLSRGHDEMEVTPPPRGDGADGADAEAWAAASAKLLDLAGDLSGAAAAAGAQETASSLAETLASAFAVMPASEVSAILVRKLREEARGSSGCRRESSVPDNGVAGCFGSGMHDDRGAVVVGGGEEGQPPASRMSATVSGGGVARASSPATAIDADAGSGESNGKEEPGAEQQQPKHVQPPHYGQSSSDVEEAGGPGGRDEPAGGDRRGGRRGGAPAVEGVEKDAAHFKMVADRFRALMERRERKLEEAMSDPQTRRDLEVMFPGVITGDYSTLLAGVRGMEEEEFQDLLDAARKRRREQEELGAEIRHDRGRKEPKTAGAPSPSSSAPPPRRSPNGSSSVLTPPPPPPAAAAWEGRDGRRGRHYAQPPPPHQPLQQQQQQQQQRQRPHAYADPYAYSRAATGDGERHAVGPPGAALGHRGQRGSGGGGSVDISRAAHAHPTEDEVDDNGVFPHYSAPAGALLRRNGERPHGGGGHSGGGGPPPVWSRQQQHPLHPTARAGGVQAGEDGQVVSGSRPVADAVVATATAAGDHRVEGRGGTDGREGGRGGRSRTVAPADDYYDHPFYQGEREHLGNGGMVRGGGGRGTAGRMHYNDPRPPLGTSLGSSATAAAVAAAAAGGHRPYPGPPPHGTRDRVERRSNGGQGGASQRGHPMGGHPMERGEPLLPRNERPAQPGINQALYEAVERIFRHREKHGAGGGGERIGSPSDGSKADAIGADERGVGLRGGSSPSMDAKKATMRIINIMESFDGRLDDVMADPRARSEIYAIFPGVKDREFRALLEGCIHRSQTPPLYRKPADRDYRDGDRVYSARMDFQEAERERGRERVYHREYPDDPRHPMQRPPPERGYPGPEPPPMYRDPRDRGGAGGGRFYPAPPRQAYTNNPNPNSAYDARDLYPGDRPAGSAYEDQRLAARAADRGRAFIPAKHDLPEDADKVYDAGPEATYPKYPGPSRMRHGSVDGRAGPPLMRGGDGRLQGSPALSPKQVWNGGGGRPGPGPGPGPPPPHSADPRGTLPPALYQAPTRRGSAVGVSPTLPLSEGGAYHHPPHHPNHYPHHARGDGGGHGHGHLSGPTGSPPGQGRRGSDVASPHALQRDLRPGVSCAGPPPADGRAVAITRGRESIAPPSGGHGDGSGRMDEDDGGGGAASRFGGSKTKSEDDEEGVGGVDGRHTRASDPNSNGIETPFCEVVRDESGVTRLFIPENPPIVPRRPPSKGNKRETLGDIAHRIPVSVMRPYFNYPLRTAAEAMNISVTTLKRLCRRHGVKRWPHRQISGINRAMAHLEFQQDQAGRRNSDKTNARNNQVSEQMQELLRRRKVMIEHAFESDDGGSRQPWKSSDSEDDGGGGGRGGGGDDQDNLSDTNSNRRRSAPVDRRATAGKKAPHPDDSTSVAPAYNPITADAAIRAVRGGRGRMLPRSPPSSSSFSSSAATAAADNKPHHPPPALDDEPTSRRVSASSGDPQTMQSRRRLLPPARPGRSSDHPPPPMRQHNGAEMSMSERERYEQARHQYHLKREREDGGGGRAVERRQQQRRDEGGRSGNRFGKREEGEERRDGYRGGRGMAEDDVYEEDDEEIGEGEGEEDDDEEYVEEDEATATSGRNAPKREPRRAYPAGGGYSRRRSNPSPSPSPPAQQQQQKQQQHKRKQESAPEDDETARVERTPEGRRSPSPSPSPTAKRVKKDHHRQEQEQREGPGSSPISKPTSPLTCGPRRSIGASSSHGCSRDHDAASSSPPSGSRRERSRFNMAGGGGIDAKQDAWGKPKAATPPTPKEAS